MARHQELTVEEFEEELRAEYERGREEQAERVCKLRGRLQWVIQHLESGSDIEAAIMEAKDGIIESETTRQAANDCCKETMTVQEAHQHLVDKHDFKATVQESREAENRFCLEDAVRAGRAASAQGDSENG